MKYLYYILILLFASGKGFSQNPDITVGLINYNAPRAYEGYTLIYPHNQPNVYLLNNCGEIVHTWEDEVDFRPGNTAYLRSDGSLVKTQRDATITGDSIWAGGGGARVQIRSWDNELIWSYELNNENKRLHHDIAVKPNGNILMIVWELISAADAIEAGRDPNTLAQNKLWADYIQEVDPSTNEVVWEWHVMDHLVQDFDDTKSNFGVVSEEIRKVDINYDTSEGHPDWLHVNAIDYNPMLQQIMISVPTFSELWVIDNTTTTSQAQGSTGGFYFHGGDLLYRFGNRAAYKKGTEDDQLLFYQHDTHWTNEFIDQSNPMFGKVLCFNNRVGEDFSSVEIFDSSFEMYINDYEVFDGAFPPFQLDNTVTHPMPQAMYSTGLSSVQLMPNGNFLICSGRQGYIFELTPDNQIVWEYVVPLRGGQAVTQGETLTLNQNLNFRAFRYPADYEAFDNRDLSPKGYIELEPQEDWCDRLVSTSTPEEMTSKIYPNPAQNMIHVEWDSGKMARIKVLDILGNVVLEDHAYGGMKYMDISALQANLYFVLVDDLVVDKLVVID